MKNTKRQAFTIVELVIVIAVIAILSAVLIPTFGAIIKDANIAADQTAASTLTTELHLELKGEVIDSETELMTYINNIDAKKLTPKAAAHGVHFWFDMDNQMIIAKTADEIIAMVEEKETASVQSGVALMADGASVTTGDVNFRAILGGGFFLIDKGGSSIVDLLAKIDAVKDAETYTDVACFELEESDKDFDLADKIVKAVKSTIILSDYGAFYCEGATSYSVYVAMGTQCITTDRYVFNGSTNKTTGGDLPALTAAFTLPKSVLDVATGALNFTGDAVIKTPYGASDIARVFGPQSTNALIKGTDNDYKVVSGADTSDGHSADRLVLSSDSSWVADLFAKLPFESFDIAYDAATEGNVAGWNNGTLYLSYGEYVGTNHTFYITHGEDKQSYPGTSGLISWTSSNPEIAVFESNGVLTIKTNTTAKTMEQNTTKITASALNINGVVVTKEISVTIVKPTSATVGMFELPDPNGYTWKYNGRNDSVSFELSDVIYNQNPGWTIATSTPVLTVDLETGVDPLVYSADDETLSLDIDNTINLFGTDGTKTHTFEISIDGCLTENVELTTIDQSDTPLETVFYYNDVTLTSDAIVDNTNVKHYYRYYVGNGNAITLADLVKVSTGKTLGASATVKVYVENASGQRSELSEIEADVDVKINSATYTEGGVSFTSLSGVTLQFSGANNPLNEKIVIEIEPADYGAFGIEVAVVNGDNVTSANLSNYVNKALTTSIVLMEDIEITSGNRINLGANNFYGNGWVVTADTWVSNLTDTTNLTDALISVSGGTIDNIYLDGPVYPVLNYDNNNNGFYVSGISATGATTIRNSYALGFRQPVSYSGTDSTTLTVENTTLRGGNYANLLVKDGNLSLIDVTTVQDQNGIKNTVAYGTSGTDGYIAINGTSVTGMGIGLERSALNSTITIKGYLDQYNWIKNGQSATMPTLVNGTKELDANTLFGFIFNGIKISFKIIWTINMEADMGSVKYYINQDTEQSTANSKSRTSGYVHAGIMFAELGDDAPNWTESVTINEDGRTDGSIKMRNFDKLKLLFSKTGLDYKGTMVYDAADYFETDGLVVIWSHKDNRAWVAESMTDAIKTGHRYVNPTGGKVNADEDIYVIGDDTEYGITYPGYNYGE